MIIIYHTISLHTSLALDFYQIHFKAGLRQALLPYCGNDSHRMPPIFYIVHNITESKRTFSLVVSFEGTTPLDMPGTIPHT
jgi:hypothetical protein